MGYYIIDHTTNTIIEFPINDSEMLLDTMKVMITNKLLERGLHKYATKVYDVMIYDLQEFASDVYRKLGIIGRKGKVDGEFTFPYVIYESEFMKVYYGDSDVYKDRAIIVEVYDPRTKEKLLEVHTDMSNFMFKNIFDVLFPKEEPRKKYEFKIRTEK